MPSNVISWPQSQKTPSKSYTCSYCGYPLASDTGWFGQSAGDPEGLTFILICHHCTYPTFINADGRQSPQPVFGGAVANITEKQVADLYDEARRAYSASSYTAAVLCCRKLLMHIAVAKGAQAGEPFVNYVQFLTDEHFVPPDAKEWVDHIRKRGNEANHEIILMTAADAEELISFCEMLLKVIFEFPAAAKKRVAPAKAGT